MDLIKTISKVYGRYAALADNRVSDNIQDEKEDVIAEIKELQRKLEERKELVELGEALKLLSKVQNEEIDYFEFVDINGNTNCVDYEDLLKWAKKQKEGK